MSRLTDLLAQAKSKDPQLGADLEREFRVLSSRLPFGLNFERHRPEAVELPQRPIRKGDKVRVLPKRKSTDKGDSRLWQVKAVRKSGKKKVADLELLGAAELETQTVTIDDLVVVAEFRDTISLGNDGKYSGNTVYGDVGGRHEKFYYQASLEERDINHWRLSDDFDSTVAEDGGNRDHTDKKDWRTNLKAGFTPNSTDEYSINFMHQAGEKHGIGDVTGTSTISLWDWPKWDVTSVYGLGHTQLGTTTYLNTKVYYNEFKNDLIAYTDLDLTTPKWISHYDDNAYGASMEVGTTYFSHQTLKGALHYRRDNHTEWQTTYSSNFTEPKQDTEEET